MNIILPSHDYLFLLLPCLGYIKFIFGRIKNGKTYLATKQAVKVLRDGGLVISNYPIYDKKSGRSSMRWEDRLFDEPIHDALIILDEAHRMIKGLAGKDHTNYDEDKAAFFAASSHNNNEIILIAHSFTRYGPSIREAAEEFVEVRKVCKPFSGKAWYFESKTSDTENAAKSVVWPGWLYREKTFFSIEVAQCYDYHFFAQLGEEPEYQPWIVDLREPPKQPATRLKLSELKDKVTGQDKALEPTKKDSFQGKIVKALEETRESFIRMFKRNKKAILYGNIVFYTWLAALLISSGMFVIELCLLI